MNTYSKKTNKHCLIANCRLIGETSLVILAAMVRLYTSSGIWTTSRCRQSASTTLILSASTLSFFYSFNELLFMTLLRVYSHSYSNFLVSSSLLESASFSLSQLLSPSLLELSINDPPSFWTSLAVIIGLPLACFGYELPLFSEDASFKNPFEEPSIDAFLFFGAEFMVLASFVLIVWSSLQISFQSELSDILTSSVDIKNVSNLLVLLSRIMPLLFLVGVLAVSTG